MKVRPSVKKMCDKCKIIKRKGRVMVICESKIICKADLRKMQDHQAQGQGHGYLRKPQA